MNADLVVQSQHECVGTFPEAISLVVDAKEYGPLQHPNENGSDATPVSTFVSQVICGTSDINKSYGNKELL